MKRIVLFLVDSFVTCLVSGKVRARRARSSQFLEAVFRRCCVEVSLYLGDDLKRLDRFLVHLFLVFLVPSPHYSCLLSGLADLYNSDPK
jgi:hypothetical protein